ncbi:unnamed protein product [Ectocarpus sp. 4 AP-2014]
MYTAYGSSTAGGVSADGTRDGDNSHSPGGASDHHNGKQTAKQTTGRRDVNGAHRGAAPQLRRNLGRVENSEGSDSSSQFKKAFSSVGNVIAGLVDLKNFTAAIWMVTN